MDEGGQRPQDAEKQAEARRKSRRDGQTRLRSLGALAHMLPLLAFIYAAAAMLFVIAPPFSPNAPHVLICALASSAVLLVWAGMRTDDPRYDTPISIATISIAAGLGLTMFAVSGSISNTTTLAISIVAAGALIYRLSTFAVMVSVVFIGWVPLAWGLAPGEVSLGMFHLWAATLVGALVLWSRRELMFRLHDEAEEADAMRSVATEQARSLRRARDAALASTQAKGQFLANVSHEVRTPLNGILGLLQLIDASTLRSPQDDYLQEVRKSARSLLAIVNDLLDLSKVEAGQMRLELVPFDIVSVAEDIAVNYASAAHAKGIELLTEIDPRVPAEVVGDPLRVRQVISNLVNNALKFTKEGEVIVDIGVVDRGPSHAVLGIRISDSGVGISEERAEAIFRPFSQADASTTREYGGTGLGLPICRQLVGLMGGKLELESRPGKGSTFSFELRFEVEERLSSDLEAVTEAFAGMRVFVLESNDRAREMLVNQLEAWNMNVWAMTTFDGAVRELPRSAHTNVALVDLHSLGDAWRERLRELNRIAGAQRTSVIAMCSQRHDTAGLRDAGIQVRVEKPVRRAKIVAALLETLRKGASLTPSEKPKQRLSLPGPDLQEHLSTGMRVLVAEDNVINQKVVKAHLNALGHAVDLVQAGIDALAALQHDHCDAAVIRDAQRRRMAGYSAPRAHGAREAESGHTRVPIIALTAHAMAGDERTAFAAGMDDYLTKPFTHKQLQKALTRWAARPESGASGYPPDALDTAVTSQLLELEEEAPGFVCEVIDSFFLTAEENLLRMNAAIERGDLDALRIAAHMVRGGGQQLGAWRVGATCTKLENIVSVEDATPIVQDLREDLEGAREALTGLANRALDAAS